MQWVSWPKDGLRRTTVSCPTNGRDIQCRAYTSRLFPVVQCLAHSETTHAYSRVASDFCRVWGVPCEPADVAVQVAQKMEPRSSRHSPRARTFQQEFRRCSKPHYRHHDPLIKILHCGSDCGLVLGFVEKPWKSLSDMCGSSLKQRTICKRWFTFHWCQAFHHHFAEGHERAQKFVVAIQDCAARCLGQNLVLNLEVFHSIWEQCATATTSANIKVWQQ